MVIGPKFDEPSMQIVPDLKRDSGVKYMDLGVASEGERYLGPASKAYDPALIEAEVMSAVFASVMGVSPIPLFVEGLKTMVEEVIELDESDLIFEPEPIFSTSLREPQDLSRFFDLSDVGSFDGRGSDSFSPFPESNSSAFRPEEEAWFIDPESLILENFSTAGPQGFEAIPQARTISPRPKNFVSGVGDIFRGIWKAWQKETGRYPFLFMGFQFLLGGKGLLSVALPERAGTRLFFTNEDITSDDFQKIIQDPRLEGARVVIHRLSNSIKVLNYAGELVLRRKVSEGKTQEIPVPVLDGSGASIAAVPNLNAATDTLVINGVEIRFPEGK